MFHSYIKWEKIMLVENLGHVTFVNGILRVQCTQVDPEGKLRESGILEIPGGNVNGVLNALISASKAIEEKLNEIEKDGKADAGDGKKKSKENKSKKKAN